MNNCTWLDFQNLKDNNKYLHEMMIAHLPGNRFNKCRNGANNMSLYLIIRAHPFPRVLLIKPDMENNNSTVTVYTN